MGEWSSKGEGIDRWIDLPTDKAVAKIGRVEKVEEQF